MSNAQSFDTRAFRDALGSFTTGVTVVTTRGSEGDVGLTANSFNSVSMEPPMVLWSLGKSANSLPAFKGAHYFAVHILSEEQQELSNRFAKRGIDKFGGVEVARGPDDIPLLRCCAARFVCRTEYQYEGGDHIIFVGEVLEFDHCDLRPLLFHGGRYGQILKPQQDLEEDKTREFAEYSLGYLLRLCGHQMLQPLKMELQRRNLGIAQHYLLALIARHKSKPLQDLISILELGGNIPDSSEIDDLHTRGLIREVGGEIYLTPQGAKLHIELASVYKAAEAEVVQGLDADLRQTLNIALLQLVERTR